VEADARKATADAADSVEKTASRVEADARN